MEIALECRRGKGMWTERVTAELLRGDFGVDGDSALVFSLVFRERLDDAKLIAVDDIERDVAAPLADLLAVVVADVKYLDAGEPWIYTGPENANIHHYGFGKAIEWERDACHRIAGSPVRVREQQTIFTDIYNEAGVGVVY